MCAYDTRSYTATVSCAQTSSGATMSTPYSWNFTTAGVLVQPVAIDRSADGDRGDGRHHLRGVLFRAERRVFDQLGVLRQRERHEWADDGAAVLFGQPGNGVYVYGGSPSFTNSTYNAASHWVDVVFTEP
jgi:hypothetical protein